MMVGIGGRRSVSTPVKEDETMLLKSTCRTILAAALSASSLESTSTPCSRFSAGHVVKSRLVLPHGAVGDLRTLDDAPDV